MNTPIDDNGLTYPYRKEFSGKVGSYVVMFHSPDHCVVVESDHPQWEVDKKKIEELQESIIQQLLYKIDPKLHNDYVPTQEAIQINKERINLRLKGE